jgi:multidrug efflux pump subunit AcrB
VRNAVQGEAATQFSDLDRKLDVRVRATEAERSQVAQLADLEVGRNEGQPVRLGAVANVLVERGPSEIRRIGQQRAALVTANLKGRDLGSAAKEIRQKLAAVPVPSGAKVLLAGQDREMGESTSSLRFAILLAMFLVYLVMASQFESLLHPFVLMFSIPLAVVGVALALGLTGTSISVMVLIGMVILAGIVVKNAIVLVDYANRLRKEGRSKIDALVEAGSVRMRPIVMTTLTTVLGLLPMALGIGEGVEVRAPLAITLIGGLVVSTLLTLVVIPSSTSRSTGREVSLSRWSLRSPVTSSMVLVCVVVLGALSAPRIPLAFLPDVDFPGLEISIPYPNSLPTQVEEEITRPAEEALATMSRVRRIQSQSSATGSNINVQFAWGEDLGPLRVEAREKLDRIRETLPRDVDLILVNGFRSSDIPVLECRIAADRDLSRAYEL